LRILLYSILGEELCAKEFKFGKVKEQGVTPFSNGGLSHNTGMDKPTTTVLACMSISDISHYVPVGEPVGGLWVPVGLASRKLDARCVVHTYCAQLIFPGFRIKKYATSR
jgi:hypothetical protein